MSASRPTCFSRLTSPRYVGLLTGAIAALVLGLGSTSTTAYGNESPGSQPSNPATKPARVAQRGLPNGVYLYGQSTKADQYGSAYMVFRVRDRRVSGAFYMPASSFDCFHGELKTNQLALNVVDSYDQTSHPYAIALNPNATVARLTNAGGAPVEPEGYHRIQTISANDRRILNTCLAKQL